MLPVHLIIISTILMLTETPLSSGSSIQLIGNRNGIYYETSMRRRFQRHTRSSPGFDLNIELWTEPPLGFVYPPLSKLIIFNFEINDDGHVTPDYSNGLDYSDPLLLTGLAAKKKVAYLYNRQLFYDDIPHIRAILRNQYVRRANGLSGNCLGSIRDDSPFSRYKKQKIEQSG